MKTYNTLDNTVAIMAQKVIDGLYEDDAMAMKTLDVTKFRGLCDGVLTYLRAGFDIRQTVIFIRDEFLK